MPALRILCIKSKLCSPVEFAVTFVSVTRSIVNRITVDIAGRCAAHFLFVKLCDCRSLPINGTNYAFNESETQAIIN